MTDFSVFAVVVFILVGSTVLAEFLFSLGAVTGLLVVGGLIWLGYRIWKGAANG
jgi:hypothetical protein